MSVRIITKNYLFKHNKNKKKCTNNQPTNLLLLLLGMGWGAEVVPGVTLVVAIAWSSLVDRLRGIVKTLSSRGLWWPSVCCCCPKGLEPLLLLRWKIRRMLSHALNRLRLLSVMTQKQNKNTFVKQLLDGGLIRKHRPVLIYILTSRFFYFFPPLQWLIIEALVFVIVVALCCVFFFSLSIRFAFTDTHTHTHTLTLFIQLMGGVSSLKINLKK